MNTSYIAYLRVSTSRQGTLGVSLSEQRLAIELYARRRGIRISEWCTETRSASSGFRPIFRRIIASLKGNHATGLIVHKIDRGARNLADWAQLGELIDRGPNIHFVQDDLDLQSRGGRLAADIQAVIAADYVRNLREETRKGMRGRFRQGLYPLKAPIGYLDNGGGQAKTLDPVQAPQIRNAFDLFATGRFTIRSLRLEMHGRGLRNSRGKPVSINGWSRILKNAFYIGELRLKSTGEVFGGVHEPLVTRSCFDRVQLLLRRRRRRHGFTHEFRFRGLLRCLKCDRALVGELQKGHVYYRCHSGGCTCVREERVDEAIAANRIQRLDQSA